MGKFSNLDIQRRNDMEDYKKKYRDVLEETMQCLDSEVIETGDRWDEVGWKLYVKPSILKLIGRLEGKRSLEED